MLLKLDLLLESFERRWSRSICDVHNVFIIWCNIARSQRNKYMKYVSVGLTFSFYNGSPDCEFMVILYEASFRTSQVYVQLRHRRGL